MDFPIVFHSNHMLISHHEEDIDDFHIHDLEMPPKDQSRSKVKMHPGPRSNRLDDTGHLHFRDLEMTSSRSSKVKF